MSAVAYKLAAERFNNNKNYAYKVIIGHTSPLIEKHDRGDLHSYWYEALVEAATRWPVECLKERIHLVRAYRRMIETIRNEMRKELYTWAPHWGLADRKALTKAWDQYAIELAVQAEEQMDNDLLDISYIKE